MGEPSTYRSWNRPATADEVAEEQRRERRRSWVRPSMLVVLVVTVLVDAVVILVASGVQSVIRVKSGRTCATFWPVLARDTLTGVWILLALVAVTLLIALATRRPWIVVTVLVVQLGALGLLVPNLIHKRDQYLAVAAGTLSPVDVDTGGVACS